MKLPTEDRYPHDGGRAPRAARESAWAAASPSRWCSARCRPARATTSSRPPTSPTRWWWDFRMSGAIGPVALGHERRTSRATSPRDARARRPGEADAVDAEVKRIVEEAERPRARCCRRGARAGLEATPRRSGEGVPGGRRVPRDARGGAGQSARRYCFCRSLRSSSQVRRSVRRERSSTVGTRLWFHAAGAR